MFSLSSTWPAVSVLKHKSTQHSKSNMLRSLVSSSRAVMRSSGAMRFRAIATTPKRLSDAHAPPALLGEGAPDGSVPTDNNQSTGLERLQLLGHLEGIDVFDMQPLEVIKLGTKKDPILVKSYVRFFSYRCSRFSTSPPRCSSFSCADCISLSLPFAKLDAPDFR